MKTLSEIAESYFNTLNPIAERIGTDILAIQDAYEGLWKCLSNKEKNQIINETVIHPEAIIKYTLTKKSCEGASLNIPLLSKEVTGAKYVVDDTTGSSWRDEHSAPFSWKTPSQIDLSIFAITKNEYDDQVDNLNLVDNKDEVNGTTNEALDDKTGNKKFVNDNFWAKKVEKTDSKKTSIPCQTHNMMLVGTCTKLSGFCSKLKFLPSKSYSYEVQTVVSNPTTSCEGNFLDRIKANAVLKFQNTLKYMGGKGFSEKKENREAENLVQSKGGTVTIIKFQKPSPKIAKPKSPPPPPPVLKLQSNENKNDSDGEKGLIFVKNARKDKSQNENDLEKTKLLEENSVQSFLSADPDSLEQDIQTKVVYDISDDFNSVSTECTPLSGPTTDIPKSGFDFLDNW